MLRVLGIATLSLALTACGMFLNNVTIENESDHALTDVYVDFDGKILHADIIRPGERRSFQAWNEGEGGAIVGFYQDGVLRENSYGYFTGYMSLRCTLTIENDTIEFAPM